MFATAQSLRVTPLAAPKRVGGARRAARAVRPVRAHAKKADDVEPTMEPLSVSRRVLGLSSVLGAASLTTDLVFPTPAEAKKIVSGYTPLEGFDVTYVFHKTGTMGADDWYKNAFKPFLDGGLHSGEVGGPETGAAFKTVFNVVVMRGRETENETVAVAFVHPKASTDLIAKFFDDKNPFWQTGRDEGWLLGPLTNFKTTPFLARGADPKTGYPPQWKKGSGVLVASFGLKIDKNEWIPAFTSPDSDKLHDAAGIYTSVASTVNKGSEYDSAFKAVQVFHTFKNFKQAVAFDAMIQAKQPPFDAVAEITDNFQGQTYEVISDTNFPEYFPQA
eukprot:CAMPEP_0203019402 /NCGR_PEP_ID=MMETSP1401-20130829/25680_1 /ASSEMBLY_ACC=CAM_ASM_000894 /TAXON_ID=38833 /ORGANISM="Micromonas pusilla, Strain CCAC1681" /LENGTH=331 /DNA_ID=CAMNT_0049761159 /DNA_START=403 /DNA_END=1398 /DNA_ORIENTATION=-